MFTGIVEEVGVVEEVAVEEAGARLAVRAPRLAPLAAVGDSIAVSGCCLTAVDVDGELVRFDAVPETLARTALGGLAAGDPVNLEDALRAGEPFGGHIVQGHVDAVGEISAVAAEGTGARMRVAAPEDVMRFVVEKGSIAVAGVSLTIAGVEDDGFEVALIPHTLAATTLGRLGPGDRVNLETDVLARHVEQSVARLLGR